jgi:hypothetical protein
VVCCWPFKNRPYSVHITRSKSDGKILFKLLGALAALVLIGFGLVDRSEIASIQKHGMLATVEPISGYTEHQQSALSTYTAEIRFKTADGRKIVQNHSFPEEVLSDLSAGRPVQVVYLPNDPSTFVFAREKASWLLVLGGAAFLVCVLIFA